ncbi:MAG TPA: hypothetical protein VNT51_05770 [Miltoncostaeaceae bacterium]|nr:hypothetical protein [Miltoncostaeaceae bacterium]
MSWDPVSRKLAAVAPINDERLTAAFARWEGLTITELDDAWDRVQGEFRAWVEAPENAGRPIQEAPCYIDRIAIDSLRERRTWWE